MCWTFLSGEREWQSWQTHRVTCLWSFHISQRSGGFTHTQALWFLPLNLPAPGSFLSRCRGRCLTCDFSSWAVSPSARAGALGTLSDMRILSLQSKLTRVLRRWGGHGWCPWPRAGPLNAGLPQPSRQHPATRVPVLRDPSKGALGMWSPPLGKWLGTVVRSRSSLAGSAGKWPCCGSAAVCLSGLAGGCGVCHIWQCQESVTWLAC